MKILLDCPTRQAGVQIISKIFLYNTVFSVQEPCLDTPIKEN